MLGSIHCGRVAAYQGGQADLVYLVSHVDRVRELDLPVVISDRNAVKPYAAFSDDLAQLDQMVGWRVMEDQMWNNTPEEPDRMERRMAELLVYQEVPWAAFLGGGHVRRVPGCSRPPHPGYGGL
jgi:hypothetical protein